MAPFFLVDLLGLDTVFHVAEHLHESYGDRFYVPKGMGKLVEEGNLGAKTGGDGFYKDGEPNIEGDGDPDSEELTECSRQVAREACLLIQDRDCTVREIDLGMMAGAGLDPRRGLLPPFMRADVEGLDRVLERSRTPRRSTASASRRRRSSSGSSPRAASAEVRRRASTPTRSPTTASRRRRSSSRRRGGVAIAWLANGQVNSIAPQVIADLETVWDRVKAEGKVRALVIASSSPVVFSAGRRHQGVH